MTVLLPSTAETDLAKFALSLQQLAAGRSNATGTVTLTAGASSTVVSAVNCAPTSAVFLFPKTTDAVPSLSVIPRIFTATGTYTPSAGMVYCTIECVGSGGGGGSATSTAGTTLFAGAGGGSGGYSRLLATAATIGVSQAVTVGNAGTGGASGSNNGTAGSAVSVGTLCIANGGGGGTFASAAQVAVGGAGGAAGTGDLAAQGAPGINGSYSGSSANATSAAGAGGSSFFGGGAAGHASTALNAGAYGSGGAGGYGTAAGSNGSKGVVFITEHCFAAAASPTFISSVGKQTFTISHANNAIADRTYFYVCLG